MSDNLIARHETSLGSPNAQAAQSSNGQDQLEGRRPMFTSKLEKLEFPRYSGDDPTAWFTRVGQFFEYQNTSETHKVSLASFHLEDEANQWWQWLRRAYHEEGRLSLGVFLSKNYGLILVQLIVRTLMKHYQKLSKKAPYEIIKKSLRG